MFHSQGASKQTCRLLAVFCGRGVGHEHEPNVSEPHRRGYPVPELVSSGRLEVRVVTNPTTAGFQETMKSFRPDIAYLPGEQHQNDERVGNLVWDRIDFSDPEAICGLFISNAFPTTVYLEIESGERLAEALLSMGIPNVIYWRNTFSHYAACHFRHALFSVLQSSFAHTWDAFQLAHASFRLYCVQNKTDSEFGPQLLGDPPKIDVTLPEIDAEEGEESSPSILPAINIYDGDHSVRFLLCGVPCAMDACLLGSLEDGLKALLNIEIRGSKLHNRASAPPPHLQAGAFSRGVVTMRCDLSTCSSAYVSFLVSGSAQTCFDDQILENHVKNEIVEKNKLVQSLSNCNEYKLPLSEPRKSASVACGASVIEVCMKVPAWASQVLRQLALDVSYRSFVALGIASIQGHAVASFEKADADRLLFFSTRHRNDIFPKKSSNANLPPWLRPPVPCRSSEPCRDKSPGVHHSLLFANEASFKKEDQENKRTGLVNGVVANVEKKLKAAAMRPVPHTRNNKMVPFSGISEADGIIGGNIKASLPIVSSSKHNVVGLAPTGRRKAISSSVHAKQIVSLNPRPLKKHGCDRSPMLDCSEDEFLNDVMQFLILRGHTRLIPQGGLAKFPDAVLNAKCLDLYNLYREVVSRGGFHVGNGINWKGQVFSKMHNYTATNRMTIYTRDWAGWYDFEISDAIFWGQANDCTIDVTTNLDFREGGSIGDGGVGNTLKRHYETYLLEYELAHDDVDGECCLLCHSATGDWVNCGMCGEWAHFGCDRRQGLGAFKDYAKTDGLEYICPQCSSTKLKKKIQKTGHGLSQGLPLSTPE